MCSLKNILFILSNLILLQLGIAEPNLGITSINYSESLAIISGDIAADAKLESSVVLQLENFNQVLGDAVMQIKMFNTFDGESVLAQWNKTESTLIDVLAMPNLSGKYIADMSSRNSEESMVSLAYAPANDFILFGTLDKVKSKITKDKVFDATLVSVICDLSLVANYKLIDIKTRRIVYDFYAIGYGGTARLLGKVDSFVGCDQNVILNDAIDNLAYDIARMLSLLPITRGSLFESETKSSNPKSSESKSFETPKSTPLKP